MAIKLIQNSTTESVVEKKSEMEGRYTICSTIGKRAINKYLVNINNQFNFLYHCKL